MKKPVLLSSALLLAIFQLGSCTTLKGVESTTVSEEIKSGSIFYLNEVRVEPQYIMNGISNELPCLIHNCLLKEGFKMTNEETDAHYKINFFMHRKKWTHDYSSFESITMRISIFVGERQIAYRIYTEDTNQSIDSFPWIFALIKQNISEFTKDLSDEI